MKSLHFLRIKNAMLLANMISNVLGVAVVLFLVRRTGPPVPLRIAHLAQNINQVFIPLSFLVPVIITIIYERPIRGFLNQRREIKSPFEALPLDVKRRLLNEPFFLIALDLIIWIFAAILYSSLFRAFGAESSLIRLVFLRSFFTGLISTTIAFFVFEFVFQRHLVPWFFPEGGLYMTPGTYHIRIGTRLVALLFACNLIPFFAVINSSRLISRHLTNFALAFDRLQSTLLIYALLFMAVGTWLTFLVRSNLTKPLKEIIRVLREVRHGRFDSKVRVTTNDEIGYAGDVINEMTEGLKERDFIKDTFGKYVSEEIRDEILSGNIPLDGELKEVTVIFADLRNYTPMVESISPKEVVKIINGYFKEMEEAIRECQGLVLQYIGDEIEAVFGAPIRVEKHPYKAVQAAQEMGQRLRALNRVLQQRGYPPLSHGIGIHTGKVLAANIGSPDRLSYALVGDTVNLASRLQGLNKEFGTEVILSSTTRAGIGNHFRLKPLPPTRVKGKADPVEIFTLI